MWIDNTDKESFLTLVDPKLIDGKALYRCTCGKGHEVTPANFKFKRVRSCGCLRSKVKPGDLRVKQVSKSGNEYYYRVSLSDRQNALIEITKKPTIPIRELAVRLGYSVQKTQAIRIALRESGFITWENGTKRTTRVLLPASLVTLRPVEPEDAPVIERIKKHFHPNGRIKTLNVADMLERESHA